MEHKKENVTIEKVAKEIFELIRRDIVAIYKQEPQALEVRFLNGQRFRLSIEEIE